MWPLTVRDRTCVQYQRPLSKSKHPSSRRKCRWIRIWRTRFVLCAVSNMDHIIAENLRASGLLNSHSDPHFKDCNLSPIHCFRYFCRQCWQMRHGNDVFLRNHKPLTRNSKSQQIIGVGPQSSNGQQSFHSQMNDNSTQNDRNTPSSPVGSLNSMLNPLSYGLN